MRGRRSGEMLGRVAAALPSRTSEEIFCLCQRQFGFHGLVPFRRRRNLSCCHAPTGKVGRDVYHPHPSGTLLPPVFFSLPPRSKTGVFASVDGYAAAQTEIK